MSKNYEYMKQYRQDHKEEIRERIKRWRQERPEWVREQNHKQYLRRKALRAAEKGENTDGR